MSDTIDVPVDEAVLAMLTRRVERRGQSLDAYVLGLLDAEADRPDPLA